MKKQQPTKGMPEDWRQIWDSNAERPDNFRATGRGSLLPTTALVGEVTMGPRSLSEDIFVRLTDRQKALLGFIFISPTSELDYADTRGDYETIERNRKSLGR